MRLKIRGLIKIQKLIMEYKNCPLIKNNLNKSNTEWMRLNQCRRRGIGLMA
jgi:hypothetical protein